MTVATAEGAPPALFNTAPAAAPTIYPTRLRPSHVLVGVGFLLVAATASILIGPADLPAGAVLKDILSKLPFVHQFVWGESDGPVSFHYPSAPYREDLLLESAHAA